MKTTTITDLESKLRPATEDEYHLVQDEDIRDCIDELMVYDGDLILSGHLDYSDAQTLVKGNLTVAGTLSGDETGLLSVSGTLVCKNLFMEGSLDCSKAEIKEVAFGCYEAGITSIREIKGKVLLLGNHCFEGDEECFDHTFTFDNFSGLRKGDAADLENLLTASGFKSISHIVGLSGDEDGEKYRFAGFMSELLK